MNTVNLTGVPETMLWTLHNRASEARRADTYLHDPECVRIHGAIDYDYSRNFGRPDDSHPMRSKRFDEALRPWMKAHPGGTVVELGVGLETQFQRCDDGQVRWLCVDVPEAMAMRERFIQPTPRCRHIASSALDLRWMDEVDAAGGLFVTAQGLFMYFHEQDVKRLLLAVIDRFPGVEIMFDAVPPWFSRKTLADSGFRKTRHYVTPRMPWGVRCTQVGPLLRGWDRRIRHVSAVPYGFARGAGALLLKAFALTPGLRDIPPCIVRVRTKD
jgi:O-methyltransferase involved in polyketide biosynthesis